MAHGIRWDLLQFWIRNLVLWRRSFASCVIILFTSTYGPILFKTFSTFSMIAFLGWNPIPVVSETVIKHSLSLNLYLSALLAFVLQMHSTFPTPWSSWMYILKHNYQSQPKPKCYSILISTSSYLCFTYDFYFLYSSFEWWWHLGLNSMLKHISDTLK